MKTISAERRLAIGLDETRKIDNVFSFLNSNSTDASYNDWLKLRPIMIKAAIDDRLQELLDIEIQTTQWCEEAYEKLERKKNLLVTCSFPLEDYEQLASKRYSILLKKLQKLTYISHYGFSFEFHSASGINPHVHIMLFEVKKSVNNARVIRDFSNLFKIEDNFVDVKRCRSDTTHAVLYLSGKKILDKQEYVKKDNLLKEKLNIPQYFFSPGNIYALDGNGPEEGLRCNEKV